MEAIPWVLTLRCVDGENIYSLVGFGLACAPVRCAHPSSWAHWHAKRGAARPPPNAALLLHIHCPLTAKLHPSELSCTILSYAAP